MFERSACRARSEFCDPAPKPSTTAQSDQREDRRSEAEHAARPRLGARQSNERENGRNAP